jgi:hypothetical protein
MRESPHVQGMAEAADQVPALRAELQLRGAR